MAKTAKMKCVLCERDTTFREAHITLQPGNIRARASQCTRCGEYYIESGSAQRSLLLNQLQRGVKVKVGQLGNSTFARFPAVLSEYLHLKKGREVVMRLVLNKGSQKVEMTPA